MRLRRFFSSRFLTHALPGVLLAGGLAGCGDTARLLNGQDTGATPTLEAPVKRLIPTVDIAPAKGWPAGATPTPMAGLTVAPLATGLGHPRWVYVLPNGDVLVAETNAPPKPDDGKGIKGWIMKQVMARAGAGVPSANRITLLRDTNGDGKADVRTVFLQNLMSPFGMALVGNTLYVANADAVVKFPYQAGATSISAAPVKVIDLPGGPINHHWTKNLIPSADGSKLYVTVGSNSNVGERGVQAEEGRAAIWEVDPATGAHRIFASGLRNPNGMGWSPDTGALWTVVNERDELGSDLVPDYLTSVKDGAFYGWPYSYYGQHVDTRVSPPRPDLVASAIPPDYALGSHVAPLGMAFSNGKAMPPAIANGVFVGEHGSWNRNPPSGYKVTFVPFQGGKPAGKMVDVLTGFLSPGGDAYGRPVGVAMDNRGALLVADDVGNVVWRVTAAPAR
ncbi:sorbosone dehydrogenase family protein [Polaromonas sp.]|jgi:glucose/arabinose dehydrogenase|uniref:PQQ-dependent sugar dehydrogenase n=2 Tax=Polaromonas sp. TaxID=1869339 RepID=UPI002BD2F761|nr:sorbosone dehydrogenase family protein [Polaromonas sp.]HQS92382.1 sorbosone dehydrogenase family protein [Polaromonas sp.]